MLLDLLDRLFTRPVHSRDDVTNRLRLVLAHDRSDLPPHLLDSMRKEILEVMSRYVELDTDAMDFSLENDQRTTMLIVNLPIRRLRDHRMEDEHVQVPNLEIPEVGLDEEGNAIASSISEADAIALEEPAPANALSETLPAESPSPIPPFAPTEPAFPINAGIPDSTVVESDNVDLDLSNLDFSSDSSQTNPSDSTTPSPS